MVAIAAPAVAATFPDHELRLNGFLASLGVEAVFDVSFGAELTVKTYLDYMESKNPDLVIAQPCPVIVTYIETYQPELIPFLAPADSPMLHTIKLIREYYPRYARHRVMVISPCIAKRREFDATGLGDFNVTVSSLRSHLESNQIELGQFPAVPYASPLPERAVLFSTPGGLKQTVERERPGIGSAIRKIEGTKIIYDYLAKLPETRRRKMNPLIVDCLNCDMGCNGGTGTDNHDKSPDEVEHYIEKRKRAMQKQYAGNSIGAPNYKRKVNSLVSRYWKPGLYGREYCDRSENYAMRKPNTAELAEIHRKMLKAEPKDYLNCSSCGYNSCEMMAVAVFNGLNKPENCRHYEQTIIRQDHETYARISATLDQEINRSTHLVQKISATIQSVNERSRDQYASLEQSSAVVEEMIASIANASKVAVERTSTVAALMDEARKGEDALWRTVSGIEEIERSVESIRDLIAVITGVAEQTNLLSMNAAIEAAHAGDAGRGFSVVAEEIRKLADTTAENVESISETLSSVIGQISQVARISRETDSTVGGIISDIVAVADSLSMLTDSLAEMSVGSGQITTALAHLRTISSEVKEKNAHINEIIVSVHDGFGTIVDISSRNLESLAAGSEVSMSSGG